MLSVFKRGVCSFVHAKLMLNHRKDCEVLRVATDGTPNACSALLGAAARAAKALGYLRIQTYPLPDEGGA